VLQIAEPDHQSRRLGGATKRAIELAKLAIKTAPFDQPGKPVKLMPVIQQVLQPAAKKIGTLR
jgi:hypothetical protein